MTSRFFTKPLVAINFDYTGAAVVLGRAESIPMGNAKFPSADDIGFKGKLINAVESEFPEIQAYTDYNSHSPLITMSRAAERASGKTAGEMSDAVENIIARLSK